MSKLKYTPDYKLLRKYFSGSFHFGSIIGVSNFPRTEGEQEIDTKLALEVDHLVNEYSIPDYAKEIYWILCYIEPEVDLQGFTKIQKSSKAVNRQIFELNQLLKDIDRSSAQNPDYIIDFQILTKQRKGQKLDELSDLIVKLEDTVRDHLAKQSLLNPSDYEKNIKII